MNRIEQLKHRHPVMWAGALSMFALAILLSQPEKAQAQWATNGTNINNTNTGNVGVGTTTPTYKLETAGSIGATNGSTTYVRLVPDNSSGFIKMKQGTDPLSPPAFINGGYAERPRS